MTIPTSEEINRLVDETPISPPEDPIDRELRRLRVRHTAQTRFDAELHPPAPMPEPRKLSDLLLEPIPDLEWRVEGWLPAGTRGLLVAQFKAGKTTLVDNLIRSLVDGEPFLDTAAVQPVGKISLIDLEMTPAMLTRWLDDLGIVNSERVDIYALRGRVSAFRITDTERREAWARVLAGTDVLIVDPLRALLDALGVDEHRETGTVLMALDELLAKAGIGEGVIAHHMGHHEERARGDSRLRDWPDWEWRLVRQDTDPASPRYLTAYGRDIEQPESAVTYDETTRRLTLVGGTRKDAAAREALDDILEVLTTEPITQNAVERALADTDHGRAAIRKALRLGEKDGLIQVTTGPRKARLHARK